MTLPNPIRISSICDIYTGINSRKTGLREVEVGGVPIVFGSDLRVARPIDIDKLRRFEASETPPPHAFLKVGDLLLPTVTRRAGVSRLSELTNDCLAHSTVKVIRPKPGAPIDRLHTFVASPEFVAAIAANSSTLRDSLHVTSEVLANLVLPALEEVVRTVASAVGDFSRELIRIIARNPDEIFRVEWRDLERLLATAFEGIGFDVELTPSSKDGGKDIVLQCVDRGMRKTYIVELKHWVAGNRVGGETLEAFLQVVVEEKRDSGLFLSTTGFTRNAWEALSTTHRKRIRVGEREKMVSVCETFVRQEGGLWRQDGSLTDLLFDGTGSAPE